MNTLGFKKLNVSLASLDLTWSWAFCVDSAGAQELVAVCVFFFMFSVFLSFFF